jgi:hypothetical protein
MKDFLYIKPQKTGTKSVRYALSKYTDNNRGARISNANFKVTHHKTFLQYKKIYNDAITEDTVLIMSIRNPFDRLVSWFFYTNKSGSFIDAVKNCSEILKLPRLTSFNQGSESINYIRFENLQEDFNTICDKIGIPRQKLPHKNKTNHKHYTEYYDDETKQIVAEKYRKDIEYFGYEFGGN